MSWNEQAFVFIHRRPLGKQGRLVGGRRGLATGARQRNSRLFTFSLWLSPFLLFPSFFPLTPHIQQSSPFPSQRKTTVQWKARDTATPSVQREEWLLRFSLSIVRLSRNASPGKKIEISLRLRRKSCIQFTVADSNMKPGTQTLAICIYMQPYAWKLQRHQILNMILWFPFRKAYVIQNIFL